MCQDRYGDECFMHYDFDYDNVLISCVSKKKDKYKKEGWRGLGWGRGWGWVVVRNLESAKTLHGKYIYTKELQN